MMADVMAFSATSALSSDLSFWYFGATVLISSLNCVKVISLQHVTMSD